MKKIKRRRKIKIKAFRDKKKDPYKGRRISFRQLISNTLQCKTKEIPSKSEIKRFFELRIYPSHTVK